MSVGFITSGTDLFQLRKESQAAVYSCFEVGFSFAANVPSDFVTVIEMTESGEQVVVAYQVPEAFSTGELPGFFVDVAGFTQAALLSDFSRDIELVAFETTSRPTPGGESK